MELANLFIVVGSNNYALRSTQIDELVYLEHARKFPGSSGPLGLIKWTYEHSPTAENSCTGFVDFEASDTPVLNLYGRNSDLAGTITRMALAKDADIGTSETLDSLDITVVAKTANVIRFDNMVSKLFFFCVFYNDSYILCL